MFRILLIAYLALFPTLSFAFDKTTIEHVQQSLQELGYDPGPVDGAWGGKTRQALNQLRQANHLPGAHDLVGSSIALLHKLRPTGRTLPLPGQLQTNAVARKSYLLANPDIAAAHCSNGWGAPSLTERPAPVVKLTNNLTPEGKLTSEQDWYSEIGTRFTVETAFCQAGNDASCFKVIDNVYNWASSNALQSAVSKQSKKFDQVQWISGSVLRPMLSSYATARQLVDVPASHDAEVVDWFVARAMQYYLPERRTPREFKNQDVATNHQVSSSLLYSMAGALIGDRPMFERGLKKWQDAIGSLRSDGSFPAETQRGAWSLSYTGLQLNYVTGLAELARHQGIELDSVTNPSPNYQDAAGFFIRALNDYSIVEGYAARNHSSNDNNPKMPLTTAFEQMMAWIPYYLASAGLVDERIAIASLELDERICSPQQIAEGKATVFRCKELENRQGRLMLGDMLAGATLGNYNAGHASACTHADRVNFFDLEAEIVTYNHLNWTSEIVKPAWQPSTPINMLFETEVLLNHSPNHQQRFNILFESRKAAGEGKNDKFRFNLNGRATYSGHPDVSGLKIVINESVSEKVALAIKACGSNMRIETWDNNRMPSITAIKQGDEVYAFQNAECLLDALPKTYQTDVEFLFLNFDRLIEDFVLSGANETLESELLNKWMMAIDTGERRAEF